MHTSLVQYLKQVSLIYCYYFWVCTYWNVNACFSWKTWKMPPHL